MSSPPSEVKGVWFIAMKRYLEASHPTDLERIAAKLPPAFRSAVTDPVATQWYPEEALQTAIAALDEVVAGNDPRRFGEVLERCTEQGIHRFFGVLIRLSTPAFVLRKVPVMWSQIRRGPGHVQVETEKGTTTLRYLDFPYFDDPRYQVLTTSSLRTLVRMSAERQVPMEIVGRTHDSLTVRVTHG